MAEFSDHPVTLVCPLCFMHDQEAEFASFQRYTTQELFEHFDVDHELESETEPLEQEPQETWPTFDYEEEDLP